MNGKDEKYPHEKFFKEMPSYAKHLTFFGNIGIAKKNIDVKMQSKLKDRGILCMMLGYATDSSGDTYRLLNLNTNAIFKDRNVTWLDKTYGDYVRSKSEFTRKYFDGEDGSSNYNSDSDDDDMVPELNEGAKMTVPTSTQGNTSSAPVSSRTRSKTQNLRPALFAGLSDVNEMTQTLMALVGGTDTSKEVPLHFRDAWDHPDIAERKLWRDAIRKEFKDMLDRKVWRNYTKSRVPKDRRLIGNKWIFRVKNDGRHRAGLCAIGYSQIAGGDYQDNFAPVVNDVTFRLVMTLMLSNNWEADIVDVETVFLYGDLEEEIYMKIPEGLDRHLNKNFKNEDCFLLEKSIYGLVQAARQYYKKFIKVMTDELKFQKCLADSCLLMRKDENGTLVVCVYVDDTMCLGERKAIDKFKAEIRKHFLTKDEGEMTEYVGCTVCRGSTGNLKMHQPHLLAKLKREFGNEVEKMRTYDTPAGNRDTIIRVKENDKDVVKLEGTKQTRYRSGVGMLLYLVKFSRPDIANASRELAKAMDKSTEGHYKALLRAIKYVITTEDLGLTYDSGTLINFKGLWKIEAYSDSDFAGDRDTRLSVTGFSVFIGNCLVSWKSRSQKTVTLSSTEAEYVAVSEVCMEILFIKQILEFLKIIIDFPITVHCDNVGAIFLGYNEKNSQRTKHVDIRHHYVRQYVEDGMVKIIFVRSEENSSDT